MKKLHFAAAAIVLVSSTAAFAQGYNGPEYSVIGGGAAGSASSVAGVVGGTVDGVVGGVGDVVGGAVALPGQILQGRSAFEGGSVFGADVPAGTQCSVIGGGAVGTCNSAVGR